MLTKEPKLLLNDNNAGKPEGIHLMIGRRPYAAFGNSTGDRQMLEYTGAGDGARLMMLVLHDDAKREYAYGPPRGARHQGRHLHPGPLRRGEEEGLDRHQHEERRRARPTTIHDELMLDGNARLNLATFVSPGWSPRPTAHGEALPRHDRQGQYPQTAAIEARCVNIVSRLFHAPTGRRRRPW